MLMSYFNLLLTPFRFPMMEEVNDIERPMDLERYAVPLVGLVLEGMSVAADTGEAQICEEVSVT